MIVAAFLYLLAHCWPLSLWISHLLMARTRGGTSPVGTRFSPMDSSSSILVCANGLATLRLMFDISVHAFKLCCRFDNALIAALRFDILGPFMGFVVGLDEPREPHENLEDAAADDEPHEADENDADPLLNELPLLPDEDAELPM
eukprot:CAMPEP_0172676518 /NCGR_PEP_ID=MMETSP1074-20121228/14043_1 /TAXON_ID=2916 /ORGANISM="Ceratium fusus, Strain PA161109" /LENGTH=144 /DNA_ID=CAMNT_0013494201 /DNA_START=438 /DNA_END=873 /DNA_ORIENTATION=+